MQLALHSGGESAALFTSHTTYTSTRPGSLRSVPIAFVDRASLRTPFAPLRPEMLTSAKPTSNPLHVEDVRCATLLSELVYRAAESPDEAAFRQAQVKVEEAVGASLGNVRCHKSGGQRFLVGETEDAIYVAFQGTKSAIDWLANLNFFHGHFGWHHQQQQPPPPQQQPHHHPSSRSSTSSQSSFSSTSTSSSGNSNSSSSGLKRRSSRAHIGFLKRANSAAVSISELHAVAAAAGKRLVLTGHSLGGAVAVLTTVRLLRSLAAQNAAAATQENVAAVAAAAAAAAAGLGLPSLGDVGPEPRVRCISFATPAMANSDLLQEVTAAGWDQYITNIVMPEDPVVPFVNLLLKAPTSPSQQQQHKHLQHHQQRSPSGFFAGLDSPSSSTSSSSSSSIAPAVSELSRSNSHESQLSLNSTSWGSNLTFEPSSSSSSALLPDDLLAATLTAAGLGFDVGGLAGAAGAGVGAAAAAAGVGPSTTISSSSGGGPSSPLDDITGSKELASWLAAARGAVQQQAGSQPGQRSFQDSSRCNSNSVNSLFSLQSEAYAGAWAGGASSSADEESTTAASATTTSGADSLSSSPVSSGGVPPVGLYTGSYLGSRHSFGVPVVASWALDTSSSLVFSSDGGTISSSGSPEPQDFQQQQQQPLQNQQQSSEQVTQSSSSRPRPSRLQIQHDPGVADEVAAQADGSPQPEQQQPNNLGSHVARQLKRLQQQLGNTKVGRVAWVTGALAAGARCAAALAAPAAITGQPFSLLAFIPRALVGPAALALIHVVGHAAYQAALPPSHPLGQQWVMTVSGLEPVAKPLASYPRTGEGLGLQELGGLFPGHRMIAYRRRLANLVSQSSSPPASPTQAPQQQ